MNVISLGRSQSSVSLLGTMANRHGLIAGATGTGKTATLRVLAEGFSQMGVPVFLADVKGDLAGLAFQGDSSLVQNQIAKTGTQDWKPSAYPVTLWDVYGKKGHQLRATPSEMGPILLARILQLNDTQNDILTLIFKIADDEGLLLLDLKDLQALLQYVGEHAKELSSKYGHIASTSLGAIQRGIIALEEQGGDSFFGEPMLHIEDLMRTTSDGRGVVNILAAETLMQSSTVYSTMLLWLLSELFETLPEEGDLAKPKLVFFFDEAHLLFDEAPKVLLQKIEQVVRLIRSKGVGVYFITQNPLDIPDSILGQLGNRVQHALRAFTEKDQKAVKAVAQTFRSDGSLKVAQLITELPTGEALVSFLDEKGAPTSVQQVVVYPPTSRMGAITEQERATIIRTSRIGEYYEKAMDRESAYELLQTRVRNATSTSDSSSSKSTAEGSPISSAFKALLTSAMRSIGTQIGREILRGVMGSITGSGRSRRR